MLSRLWSPFRNLLETPMASRLRRNHGLEHATLHVLSQKYPGVPLAGHSTSSGFRLVGELSNEAVRAAVEEALRRMSAGEHRLAVHPNCGTNFVTAGTFAGLAGAAAMQGAGKRRWDKLERIPLAATLATIALIIAYPFGLLLQEKVTTSGMPGELEVVEVSTSRRGRVTVHRVVTRG